MTIDTTTLACSFKRLRQALSTRVLMTAVSAAVVFSVATEEAEAARFGGGRSSGFSRGGNIMKRQATPPAKAPAQSAAPAASAQTPQTATPARSPWMGMLGGLALGAGLGALLSHFGLGAGLGGILTLLLVALAIFFVVRLLFRGRGAPTTPGPLQYAGPSALPIGASASRDNQAVASAAVSPAPSETGTIPSDFDVEGFVRQAKVNFVRLQAANDAGNMDDIRSFTTPEMFAEVQLEYQERGRTTQQTDVLQLEAQLLDVTTEGARQIASVRFHGMIREGSGSVPEAFNEVWHLSRPADGSSGWVIAGIQQYT